MPISLRFRFLCAVIALSLFGGNAEWLVGRDAPGEGGAMVALLRNGSRLQLEGIRGQLRWLEIESDGSIRERALSPQEISSLELASPESVTRITGLQELISQLSSPRFGERETAENRLSESSWADPLVPLLDQIRRQTDDLDLAVRATRILERLRDTPAGNSTLDQLVLRDGSRLSGEASPIEFRAKFFDRELNVDRNRVRALQWEPSARSEPDAPAPVRSEVWRDPGSPFAQALRDEVWVDFERGKNHRKLSFREDLTVEFADRGLLCTAIEPAGSYVGISGFDFESVDAIPSRGHSICVISANGTRFRGVMEFRFCLPNDPQQPAAVHRFGACVGKSDHPRDLVLEAYNRDDQLVATVEGDWREGLFLGIESNEPLVRIRIRSNPNLYHVDRVPDEDFAVDDVCFSAPVPAPAYPVNSLVQVETARGDQLLVHQLRWVDGAHLELISPDLAEPITLDQETIRAIEFPNRAAETPSESLWRTVLTDRSLVLGRPRSEQGNFVSVETEWGTFDRDQIAGLVSARTETRFPLAEAPRPESPVLVFPGCRLMVDSLTWNPNQLEWNERERRSAELLSPQAPAPDDDPAYPEFSSVAFDSHFPQDLPTIWFRAPQTLRDAGGEVRLRDGQRIRLGETGPFQLSGWGPEGLIIVCQDREIAIAWEQVVAFQRPAD